MVSTSQDSYKDGGPPVGQRCSSPGGPPFIGRHVDKVTAGRRQRPDPGGSSHLQPTIVQGQPGYGDPLLTEALLLVVTFIVMIHQLTGEDQSEPKSVVEGK